MITRKRHKSPTNLVLHVVVIHACIFLSLVHQSSSYNFSARSRSRLQVMIQYQYWHRHANSHSRLHASTIYSITRRSQHDHTLTQLNAKAGNWAENFGQSALRNVENLAVSVTRANQDNSQEGPLGEGESNVVANALTEYRTTGDTAALFTSNSAPYMMSPRSKSTLSANLNGNGNVNVNMNANNNNNGNFDVNNSNDASLSVLSLSEQQLRRQQPQSSAVQVGATSSTNRNVVLSALANLERDMQLLDNITAEKPQLSQLELTLLSLSVLAAGSGPILFADGARVAEVLAPACAALSAAIGIGAEYTGKVAVADGKEVAAATLQCAAEAEGLLAKAERVKAVTPLCVGISATAATLSLVAPVLIESLKSIVGTNYVLNELYFLSPLVAVLSAAVAGLSLQETEQFTSRAISVGNRRFAKSGLVGRTWLSATEQIENSSSKTTKRWKSFAWSVLPAPIVGSLVPGVLSTKAVVVAALAAAQCAFFLAQAESVVARGTDAVALKSRSAAVCDTYANQGARSAAILPFTSALSSLCAAATAAIVELPLLESLGAIGGAGGAISSASLVAFFPALASLFAAAASVSKARCEVDAEAAIQAASTLALEYDDEDDPVLRPFKGVVELIRLTISTTWKTFKKSKVSRNIFQPVIFSIKSILRGGRRKK